MVTRKTAALANLGKVFAEVAGVSFAESLMVDDPEILQTLLDNLEDQVGGLERLFDVNLNPETDTFTGRAEQRINQVKSQFYQFTMSPNGWNYKLIPAKSVNPNFSEYDPESDTDWIEAVEFAAKKASSSARAQKLLKCKPGNTQCGGRCQNMDWDCKYKPHPDQVKAVADAATKVKAAVGVGSGSSGKTTKAANTKPPENPARSPKSSIASLKERMQAGSGKAEASTKSKQVETDAELINHLKTKTGVSGVELQTDLAQLKKLDVNKPGDRAYREAILEPRNNETGQSSSLDRLYDQRRILSRKELQAGDELDAADNFRQGMRSYDGSPGNLAMLHYTKELYGRLSEKQKDAFVERVQDFKTISDPRARSDKEFAPMLKEMESRHKKIQEVGDAGESPAPSQNAKSNTTQTSFSSSIQSYQQVSKDIDDWNSSLGQLKDKDPKNERLLAGITALQGIKALAPYAGEPLAVRDKKGGLQSIALLEDSGNAVEISFLASNPANFNNSNPVRGAGTRAILGSIEHSESLGYKGKLIVMSLPDAIPFYQKLGFELDDKNHDTTRSGYMTLTPEAAKKLKDRSPASFSESSTSDRQFWQEVLDLESNAGIALANKQAGANAV